jgi:hypothetical protein
MLFYAHAGRMTLKEKTPKSGSGFSCLADFVKKSKSIYRVAPSGGLAWGCGFAKRNT